MGDLIPFDSGAGLPAHLAARFAEGGGNSDLSSGVGMGYPILSYKGKVWHLVQGENRTLIANDDGEPRSSLELVLLKANPALSKIYYEGGYEEGSSQKPTCYSNDSVAPAADAAQPQAYKCSLCPHNQWGSRVTDQGSKGKACTDARRMAVAPITDIGNPMLLRIPAGSLKELAQYADTLNKRKLPYSAVLTKVGFDHTVAHQKLTFKPLAYLSDEQYKQVEDVLSSDVIKHITGLDMPSIASSELDALPGTPPASARAPVQQSTAQAAQPQPVAQTAPTQSAPVTQPADPATEAKIQKRAAILDEASASLDDVLGMLDD